MTTIVGLSGGIGSGKSTVSALFADLGAVVIDADAIVHELQAPGSPVLEELAEAFGRAILKPDGALDREALGGIVFRDPEARARIGAIMHPKVGAEMAHRLANAKAEGVPLVILDIPLLFEGRRGGSGNASKLGTDCTLLVYVPEAVQVERTQARDGCSRDEALRRVRAQMPIDEKRALADHIIDNSGTREATADRTRALYEKLTADSAP